MNEKQPGRAGYLYQIQFVSPGPGRTRIFFQPRRTTVSSPLLLGSITEVNYGCK